MSSIPESALNALTESLNSSTIFTPSSPGYQESIKRWSDTGIKEAGIVIQPTTAEDIRTALLWAQSQKCDFAVKGGGHSVAGTSSSKDGLVIDLSRLNTITVHPDTKTVTAQGGAVWKDVDEAAAKYSLAAVGGTVNHTGVGGLTLGGGYGWLSGQYGLTIDNLLSATVVLADGRIVTASVSENEDLFWGLRGAGYNFGVVVDFTFQGYDQPNPVYAGILSFPPEKLDQVVAELNKLFSESPNPKSGAMLIFAPTPASPSIALNTIVYYNGTLSEGETHYAGLLALNPELNTATSIPYSKLNSLQNEMATYGDRKSFKGLFYRLPLDTAFLRSVLDDLEAVNAKYADLMPAVLLECYDMRKTCSVPFEQTAFANRSAAQNGIVHLRWKDAALDGEFRAWARTLQGRFKEFYYGSGSVEAEGVPQYINYAEPGDAVVGNIYGVNLERLKLVKAKYDPGNVFCKMHPVLP
ncbi:FAD/FMN-containing dehydrogenase [Aspergillus avenaceus]|uniref:FAD/FMN-containing dehydrogenase n=1 Tax=Aspergillus avenaceus TaxID=36643 RepID=A0A5N6U4N1_ASPAV|nr:FAD/FMN-containing dehydrogenase [Aspergillus avenaceus]